MTTALYRLSSNEVLKVSPKDQPFSDRDAAVYGVLIDPTTPDGLDVRDRASDPIGDIRVLGFAKIANPGGNDVHNATQVEIDGFAAPEDDDNNKLDAGQALAIFKDHPQFRKMMTAFADILKDEINILRRRNVQFQDDVVASLGGGGSAASKISALEALVSAYPVQSDRTLAQLKTQINNRISKDD